MEYNRNDNNYMHSYIFDDNMKDKLEHKKYYYSNGQIASESYWLNGKYHREDGPAYIRYYDNGQLEYEAYWLNGKRYRIDGPSWILYYENGQIEVEEYLLNDKYHREDGPAYIGYYENGQIKSEKYYINNREYSKQDYKLELIKRNSKLGQLLNEL